MSYRQKLVFLDIIDSLRADFTYNDEGNDIILQMIDKIYKGTNSNLF